MSEGKILPRRVGRVLIGIAVLVAAALLAGRLASGFFVEVLWYRQEGFTSVFWTRTLWQWGVRLLVGGAAAALVFVNLRIVASTLGGIQIKRRFGDLEISEQLPRSYVLWGMTGCAALMGLWFAAAVPEGAGVRALLLLHAPEWGVVEPVLGRDVSFYVFLLPMLGAAVTFALVLLFLLFSLSAAGYAVTGALQWREGRLRLADVPRHHLGALTALFLVILAGRFWLGRSLLLLDGNSGVQGIFGYADYHARLPGLQALTLVALVGAAMVAWGTLRNRVLPIVAGIAGVFLGGLAVAQVYPTFVQRFRVEPNELARETPFIEHALEFTRRGFGLHDLERRRFEYTPPDEVDWDDAREQFAGLPVWSAGALLTIYRELEARFRYYDFLDVDIDRYPAEAGLTPVAVSVREVDPGGIEDPNWQNLHIRERYITGMGAVASQAADRTAQGRPPMILSAIPPEFSPGPRSPEALRLERAQVFFGAGPQLYAVINPSDSTFLAPDSTPGRPGVDFPEGIVLSSPFHTLALAWRFRDANLLFASEVDAESRFVFRRQVSSRVRAVAPFLEVPGTPYPVVHEGRIVWIQDAYTTTRSYPLSTAHELEPRRRVSYLRNSVKVTVDALTGAMRFYVVEPDDPLLEAYGRAFPGLFHPMGEMPPRLREHIRYPRDLLGLQAEVLVQYHQETAPLFHGQQDVWAIPQELAAGTRPVTYEPAYGIFRLPGESEAAFLLTTVFVPAGRQNLTALLVARNEPDRYGELVLYDVPVDDQVPGPRQVEALVEQDPEISQQFSLWRQGGSQVWSGHLHLVPVGRTLLYMEPVFLAAEEDAIPELRRYVVSDGRRVEMEPTLEGAIRALSPDGAGASVLASDSAGDAGTGTRWSREALETLEEAERRLRTGDFEGFGEALDRLRRLLEDAAGAPPARPGLP